MFKFLISSSFLVLFIFGCKSTKTMTVDNDNRPTDMMECDSNESSYQICTEINEFDGVTKTKFVLYDTKNDTVLIQETLIDGYVKWLNNEKVEFYSRPGMIKSGETKLDYTWVYDLKTNKRTKKSDITQLK